LGPRLSAKANRPDFACIAATVRSRDSAIDSKWSNWRPRLSNRF
jgi:hypothetical protein